MEMLRQTWEIGRFHDLTGTEQMLTTCEDAVTEMPQWASRLQEKVCLAPLIELLVNSENEVRKI